MAAAKVSMRSVRFFPRETTEAIGELYDRCIEAAMREGIAKMQASMNPSEAGEPSAPGTPPNIQTGVLVKSIRVVKRSKAFAIGMAFYGWIHEFGGRIHPRRPFVQPVLPDISRALVKYMRAFGIGNTAAARRAKAQANAIAANWLARDKTKASLDIRRTATGQIAGRYSWQRWAPENVGRSFPTGMDTGETKTSGSMGGGGGGGGGGGAARKKKTKRQGR